MREKQVITPAGGGDRVRYTPYKDIEPGFNDVLENVFLEVKALDSNIAPNINNNSVDYVVSLEIDTDSSSASMFTWPPTWFGVALKTDIFNTETKKTTKISAKGEGTANYSKFLMNKGITGQEAALDALKNLQMALLNSDELTSSSAPSVTSKKTAILATTQDETQTPDVEERLATLTKLNESGLISTAEHEKKRAQIVKTCQEKTITPTVAERLATLKKLNANGLISDAEYANKRTEIINTL